MHELEMLDYICKIIPDVGLVKAYIIEYLSTITMWYNNNPSEYNYSSFNEYIYCYICCQMRLIIARETIFGTKSSLSIVEPSRLHTLIHAYHFSPEHLLWLLGMCSKCEAYEQVAILEQRIAEIGGCKSLTDRFNL